jgi:hypothetical protein
MFSILENLLTPVESKGSKEQKEGVGKNKLQVYPTDVKQFIKWGSVGFMGLGLYQFLLTLSKRNINPCIDFQDPVEALDCDPVIRDAMIRLQNYRELNPWLFKTALQNIDQLLFLENALLSKGAHAAKKDKDIAFTYFRMGVNRLNQLQFIIRKELGTEHGMAVHLLVKQIYGQMQKHLLNVLHLCSKFRPDDLIARAPLEVRAAIKRMEEGRKPEDTYNRWHKLRGKLDEDEQNDKEHRRRHHRHRRRREKSPSPSSPVSEISKTSHKSEKSEKSEKSQPSSVSKMKPNDPSQ